MFQHRRHRAPRRPESMHRGTRGALRHVTAAAMMVLAAALPLLPGCGSGQAVDPPQIGPQGAVPFLDAVAGSSESFAETGIYVINEPGQLMELSGDPLAELDYDLERHSILVAALGEQATGGYWIRLTSAQFLDGQLFVQGLANMPGPDEMVTQAVTHPFHAVVTPKVRPTFTRPEISSTVGEQPPIVQLWSRPQPEAEPAPDTQPADSVDDPVDPTTQPADLMDDPMGPATQPADPMEEPADPADDPADPMEAPADPADDPADPMEEPADPVDDPADPMEEPADPADDPVEPMEEPMGAVDEPEDPTDERIDTAAGPTEEADGQTDAATAPAATPADGAAMASEVPSLRRRTRPMTQPAPAPAPETQPVQQEPITPLPMPRDADDDAAATQPADPDAAVARPVE